eukprot:754898-Hanusia_phi.AAC.3
MEGGSDLWPPTLPACGTLVRGAFGASSDADVTRSAAPQLCRMEMFWCGGEGVWGGCTTICTCCM